jgi:TolB protein
MVSVWRGNGELAVISDGRLRLVDNDGSSHLVGGPGTPSEPSWSPDGKWVAFLRTPMTPPLQSPAPALWLARPDGTDPHRVSALHAAVVQFAWSPAGGKGETLAFSVVYPPSYASSGLFLVTGPMPPRRFATYSDLIGFSWAPSGAAIAVSYRKGPMDQPEAGQGFLELYPLDGKAGRIVYTLADNGYADLAGWWPDGKGLLFWDDPAGSASIAADGLALDSFDLATLKVRPLALTLVHSNWLAWSPDGETVALVAGGDREIWYSGKHIELCAVPTGDCHALVEPSDDVMSLDPAWTGVGSLIYVLAPTVAPSHRAAPPVPTATEAGDHGNWDPSGPWSSQNVAAWYAAQRLFTSTPGGGKPRVVLAAGLGAHDPVVTSRGLLYVHDSWLRYLPDGTTMPVTVARGLQSPSPYGNYYGYIDWSEDFAWHE